MPRADRGGARDRRAGAVDLRPDAWQHRDDRERRQDAPVRQHPCRARDRVPRPSRVGQPPGRRALRADGRGRHRVHGRRARPRRTATWRGPIDRRSTRGSTTSRPSSSRCGSRRTHAPPDAAQHRFGLGPGHLAPFPGPALRRSTDRSPSESAAGSESRWPPSCAAPAGCALREAPARSRPSGWRDVNGSADRAATASAEAPAVSRARRVGPSVSCRPSRRRVTCVAWGAPSTWTRYVSAARARLADPCLPGPVIGQHQQSLAVVVEPTGRIDTGERDIIPQQSPVRRGELRQHVERLVEQDQAHARK